MYLWIISLFFCHLRLVWNLRTPRGRPLYLSSLPLIVWSITKLEKKWAKNGFWHFPIPVHIRMSTHVHTDRSSCTLSTVSFPKMQECEFLCNSFHAYAYDNHLLLFINNFSWSWSKERILWYYNNTGCGLVRAPASCFYPSAHNTQAISKFKNSNTN